MNLRMYLERDEYNLRLRDLGNAWDSTNIDRYWDAMRDIVYLAIMGGWPLSL